MLKVSLWFLFIGVCALFATEISITTIDPWSELHKLALGFLTPDIYAITTLWPAFVNTISFALIGITIAVAIGFLFSLYFSYTPVRLFCSFIRSIHELFWAFIFMPITGLNSLCGILAIAIPYAGVFAKVYSEIRQESEPGSTVEVSPVNSSRVSLFFYTTFPTIFGKLKNYTSYRFECALRSSAILGFIGLPTIGYHLETAFREGMYSEAALLLYSFYILICLIRYWAKLKVLFPALLLAVLLTSWDVSFAPGNIIRFFTYDILPWPMRAEGYYAGTQAINFSLPELIAWFTEIFHSFALPGMWNTLLLTQIALVCTALLTLLLFPFGSRIFFPATITSPANFFLVILRTTPEYILAYIFLMLSGPSMLPAIAALSLHNSGILGHITAQNVNLIKLPFDSTVKKVNRYFYEVLPRSYGHFLAFLFYRWEVIMRESAILGILGVTTLGHYIDSAITRDHLDTALFLILITAGMNMIIDYSSQEIRKRLRISAHLTTCSSSLN